MAASSIDAFAATNPAFCAVVLRAFAEGYVEQDPAGVPLSLILIPLPVLLSGDIAGALAGTNATTGLLPWIARNPEVTVGLRERVGRVSGFTREALLFGLRYRALTITPAGLVLPESAGLRKQPRFPATSDVGRVLANGRKFGQWVGQVRSPQTVLVSMGVSR